MGKKITGLAFFYRKKKIPDQHSTSFFTIFFSVMGYFITYTYYFHTFIFLLFFFGGGCLFGAGDQTQGIQHAK
jgi:hypothetical protein